MKTYSVAIGIITIKHINHLDYKELPNSMRRNNLECLISRDKESVHIYIHTYISICTYMYSHTYLCVYEATY